MADFANRRMSFLVLLLCLSLARAYNHVVYDGWKLNPSEGHNHWAERHRFQINDEIVFKYKKGDDSVLVVGEDDYKNCRKDKPIKNLNDGYSVVKFDRSGYFFFISGHDHNCEKGQKMIILSIADRSQHHPKPPSPPVNPPSHSPSHAPQPSHSPSPTYAPPAHPPSHSPSPATLPPSPSPAPTPWTTKPPTQQPPSHSPSPATPPVNPPSAHTPSVQPPHHSAPSPAPAASHDSPPLQPSHHAYPPVYLPPLHAPAPAPSSASSFGGSFILTVGLGVATILISSRIIV